MPPDVKPKSREVLRDVLPKEALEFFEDKGLRVGFSYLDVWREEHNYAFTVAKVTEKKILKSIRDLIDKALVTGTTFEQFKKDAKPLLDKSGWSNYGTPKAAPRRLKTIFQTNMRVARATGQWQRIQKTKVVLPFLQYNLGPSERHRPEHAAWDGLVLRADDPWWSIHYPPNGWGCKCWVRQVSRYEAERLGVSEAPETRYDEWVNPKTGSTELVAEGVDPGWDYNPGAERAAALAKDEEQL